LDCHLHFELWILIFMDVLCVNIYFFLSVFLACSATFATNEAL
jgi:hypothetical protein